MENVNLGPRLCVEVVIKTESGVVLVPENGLWHIPGGTVNYGEMLAEAAKRVAREEAGVEVTIERVLGYIEYTDERRKRGTGWSVGIAFQAIITGGELRGRVFKELPEEMIWEQKDFLKSR